MDTDDTYAGNVHSGEFNRSFGFSSRPRQRGALPPASQEHRSWQWTREPPKPWQRGALPPSWRNQPPKFIPPFVPRQPTRPLQADITAEQNYRPRQRGALPEQSNGAQARLHHKIAVPPSMDEHMHGKHADPVVSGGMQGLSQKAVQMRALPLHHIKSTFMDAWGRLDNTLQRNQSMFSKMKIEMEKSRLETRVLKEAALNEKEELLASKMKTLRDLEIASLQGERFGTISQQVEHISTDLSVQLAELNHLQGQVKEELAALMKTLTDPRKVGQTSEELEKYLQSHEVRISLLEKELASSKLASESLELAGLKGLSELNEVLDDMPQSILELAGTSNASCASSPFYVTLDKVQSMETLTGTELRLPHDDQDLQVSTVQVKGTLKWTTLGIKCPPHQDFSKSSQRSYGAELQSAFFCEEDADASHFLQAKTNRKIESLNIAAHGERPLLKRLSNDLVYEDMSDPPSRTSKMPKV